MDCYLVIDRGDFKDFTDFWNISLDTVQMQTGESWPMDKASWKIQRRIDTCAWLEDDEPEIEAEDWRQKIEQTRFDWNSFEFECWVVTV